MGGAEPGEKTGCSLPDTQGPTRKEWLLGGPTLPGWVEMKRFAPSVIPGLPGHQGCKEG